MGISKANISASVNDCDRREFSFNPICNFVFGIVVVIANKDFEVRIILCKQTWQTMFEIFLVFEADDANCNFRLFHAPLRLVVSGFLVKVLLVIFFV